MADEAHEETEALLADMERRIRREYARAAYEMQEKRERYMKEYEGRRVRMAARVEAGEITEKQFREWARGYAIGSQWYDSMVDTLAQDLVDADRKAASIVNGYTPEAYAVNHNFGTYQIEKAGMVDTSFTLYDRGTVERLLRDDPDLVPMAEIDAGRDLRWNRQKVSSAVLQSILQGEGQDRVAERLASVVGMDMRSAMRVGRTVMTGAQNAGRVDSYRRAQDMGIKLRQEWLATLDQRTRHTHRILDGERVEVGEKFSNGCRYPGDPYGEAGEIYNCRCTLVPVVEGVDQSNAPRNSKLGKMTYEEWIGEREHRPASEEPSRSYVAATSEKHVESDSYRSWLPDRGSAARDSVEKYTSNQYRSVNSYLRGLGDFAPEGKYGKALSQTSDVEYVRNNPLVRQDGESMPEFLRRKRQDGLSDVRTAVMAEDAVVATVRDMDGLIAEYDLPNDTVLFRRVGASALPDDLQSIVGGTYQDAAYMSTSIFERNNFVGSGEYLMVLKVPAGRGRGMYVNDMSASKDEYEFILARGSRFRVVSVTEDGGRTVVEMELEA